jgi:hypothetical protein
MHLVERNHVERCALEPRQHALQEQRRDFQQVVGLKRLRARRAHVMQRQDGADAAHQRTHEMMHSGEIERLQPGPDDGLLHARQAYWFPRLNRSTIPALY